MCDVCGCDVCGYEVCNTHHITSHHIIHTSNHITGCTCIRCIVFCHLYMNHPLPLMRLVIVSHHITLHHTSHHITSNISKVQVMPTTTSLLVFKHYCIVCTGDTTSHITHPSHHTPHHPSHHTAHHTPHHTPHMCRWWFYLFLRIALRLQKGEDPNKVHVVCDVRWVCVLLCLLDV